MMRCKHCKLEIANDELEARFKAGLGHCPSNICSDRVDWDFYEKYKRLISIPSEFEAV